MKRILIFSMLALFLQNTTSQELSGRFDAESEHNDTTIFERFLVLKDQKLCYSSYVDREYMGSRTYSYRFINDSTFILIDNNTDRGEVIEGKFKKICFIREKYKFIVRVYPAGSISRRPFESVNLYIVTNENDTLVYQSENLSKIELAVILKEKIDVKSFWAELPNGMKTNEYFINSKRSNLFDLFIYAGESYDGKLVIINGDTFKIEGTDVIFQRSEYKHRL